MSGGIIEAIPQPSVPLYHKNSINVSSPWLYSENNSTLWRDGWIISLSSGWDLWFAFCNFRKFEWYLGCCQNYRPSRRLGCIIDVVLSLRDSTVCWMHSTLDRVLLCVHILPFWWCCSLHGWLAGDQKGFRSCHLMHEWCQVNNDMILSCIQL